MFYAQLILAKKGVLGKIWLAAHWDKKLNRQLIFQTDVTQSAESIADPRKEMPLRVSGSLLLGVVRIFSHKVKYLSSDCDQALTRMKMSFRPDMVLEGESDQEGGADDGEDEEGKEEGTTASSKKDSRRREGQSKQATVYAALTLDTLPPVDEEWLNAAAQSMARRQDITMEEGVTGTLLEKALGLLGEGAAAEEEQWEAFDPTALGEPHGDDEEEDADGGEGHMHEDFDHGGDDMEVDDGYGSGPEDPEEARQRQMDAEDDGNDGLDLSVMDGDERPRKASSVGDSELEQESMMLQDDDPPQDPPNGHGEESFMSVLPSSPSRAGSLDVSRLSVGPLLNKTPTTDATRAEAAVKKGRKRPLLPDEAVQISGKDFKAQLTDYSDLMATRVRPKDRLAQLANVQSGQAMHGLGPYVSLEERMARPWLAGELSPELEGLFAQVMKTARAFTLPIRMVKAAQRAQKRLRADGEEEDEEEAKAQGDEAGALGNGRVGEGPMDGEGEDMMEDVGHDLDGLSDVEGGQGEWSDGEDHGMGHTGLEEGEDEDDFIAINAAGNTGAGDDGGGCKWHPNTVKMLRLLRKRIKEDQENQQGARGVGFKAISKGSRRNRAANQFFEILQLKTWDFIQVKQDQPFGDIRVSGAARFWEAIPN